MKSKLSIWAWVLVPGMLLLGGCASPVTQPVQVPTATVVPPPTAVPTQVPTATVVPSPTIVPTPVVTKVPEPTVTISPTSGPSGTRVQVIASGFPPNTPISAWLGPENSEFELAAQGMTDANGSYDVWIPVEGAPGMRFVFAVSTEGIRGVWAPERFDITSVGPTAVPVPSPTPHQDVWTTFSSRVYAVSLQYPADWQPVPGYGSPETDDTRFGGINGFFQVNAMDADSIDAAAAAEAEHKLRPYGSQPTIETLQVQGQEARLVLPSADQPPGMQNQAVLIIRYPQPVDFGGTLCRYFVLWADWPHIRTMAKTLRFTN